MFFLQPPLIKKKQEKLPHYYVPSYTYTGSIKPSVNNLNIQHKQVMKNSLPTDPKKINQKTDKNIETKKAQDATFRKSTLYLQKIQKFKQEIKPKKARLPQQSLLAASFEMMKQEQLKEVTKTRENEPIYLIGDDNAPADPLVKLIGRSLSAHFHYPRLAGELGIKGKVLIGLTLHPNGYYDDIQLIQSSYNQDLDAAALYAVNTAPIVEGANHYISRPKHFVVGFVFY